MRKFQISLTFCLNRSFPEKKMHQVTPIDALNLVRMRGNTDPKNLKYGHFLPRAMQSEIVVL